MHRIPPESIVRREGAAPDGVPLSVDLSCPFCARVSTFATRGWQAIDDLGLRATRAECPACGESPTFVWVPEGEGHALFVHPRPSTVRRPLQGVEKVSEMQGALLRTYRAAIDAFNAGQWVAATVLGGRALEAITRELVPESERGDTLPGQLVELLEHRDLEQPILVLAEALRRSRDLVDHFAGTEDPDPEAARNTLDLLDALVAYLFVLPDRVRRLRDHLAGEAALD